MLGKPLAIAIIALGLAAAPAAAQTAKPEPTTCAGLAFTDVAGDQSFTPTRLQGQTIPSARKAKDNLDVIGGFLRYAPDASGKNVLTANIQITNLDKSLEQGAVETGWYFKFEIGDVLNYVVATVGEDGVVDYSYGTQAGTSLTEVGKTKGTLHEGANGIVEIVVPVAALKLEGKTMVSPYAAATYIQSTGSVTPVNASLSNTADNGPDDFTGKDFTVTPCAEQGVPTTPQPIITVPDVVVPQAPGAAPVVTPVLDLQLIAGRYSARKINKGRRLTIRATSPSTVTGITAKLRKGSKTVATGKLARVAGSGKLVLKLRGRKTKLKKGTYTLQVSGKNADGSSHSGSLQIRIGK